MKVIPTNHNCEICHKVFLSAYSQQKVCSKECKLAFRRKQHPARRKQCSICAKEFQPNARHDMVCSKECRDIRHQLKKEKLRKNIVKSCIVCGIEFIGVGRAKTCSNICSTESVSRRVNHRYHTDLNFKLTDVLRSRLRHAVGNNQKRGSAVRDLGCSVEELKKHLESKFQTGMTWNNWTLNGWHIDHIRPLVSFDLTDPEQIKVACHYTNLQPLWARDNHVKRDHYCE